MSSTGPPKLRRTVSEGSACYCAALAAAPDPRHRLLVRRNRNRNSRRSCAGCGAHPDGVQGGGGRRRPIPGDQERIAHSYENDVRSPKCVVSPVGRRTARYICMMLMLVRCMLESLPRAVRRRGLPSLALYRASPPWLLAAGCRHQAGRLRLARCDAVGPPGAPGSTQWIVDYGPRPRPSAQPDPPATALLRRWASWARVRARSEVDGGPGDRCPKLRKWFAVRPRGGRGRAVPRADACCGSVKRPRASAGGAEAERGAASRSSSLASGGDSGGGIAPRTRSVSRRSVTPPSTGAACLRGSFANSQPAPR
jgi:hypothetical protein